MFVVMVPQKTESISDFLMDRLNPKRQAVELLRVQNTKLYMLKCRMPRTHRHWEKIYQTSSGYKNAFLIPRDVIIPYDVPLARYMPTRLACIIAVNSVIAVMEKLKIPLYRRVIGVIDMNSTHQNLVHDLLKYTASVKVLTKNKDKYRIFAKQMLEVYGAVVTLSDSIESFSDCVSVLNFSDFVCEENTTLPCPVISIGSFECITPMTIITNLTPSIPEHIKEVIPLEILQKIHPMDLLGALFEFNSIRELCKLIFDFAENGNGIVHYEEFSTLFHAKSSN